MIEHPYRDEVKEMNKRLFEIYGRFQDKAKFRIIYSENEFEVRRVTHTKDGFVLLHPEYQEMPKYLYMGVENKYVLEALTVVPEVNKDDLIDKLSYEPRWVFEDKKGNFLPPNMQVAITVIDSMYAAMNQKDQKKRNLREEERIKDKEQLDRIHEQLFGNETEIGDALKYKEGVSLSGAYKNEVN